MKYKLEDLKPGMLICKSELSEIYDTYILLENAELFEPKEYEFDIRGNLVYALKNKSDIPSILNGKVSGSLCSIYNDSTELSEDYSYDE